VTSVLCKNVNNQREAKSKHNL